MTRCWATVASYVTLPLAVADWDAVALGDHRQVFDLLDAALVEGDAETIRTVHRHRLQGGARGSVATALVGLLRPPAIVTGAVAGGVGGRVLVALGQGICRSDLMKLGEALDTARFGFIALSNQETCPGWSGLLDRSTALVSVESTISSSDLERAVELDAVDEAVEHDPDDGAPPPPAAPDGSMNGCSSG